MSGDAEHGDGNCERLQRHAIERLQVLPFVRYLASKSGMILKTGLWFVQGHWKWHHLIDRIRVPIRLS